MRKVLILGIGNLLQKDDGIGSHIIQHIVDADIKLPNGTEAIDGGTAGYDLIPLMKDREKIVIIDALKVNDAPGSVYRFSPKHLLSSREIYSLHDLGVREIIKQLNLLGDDPEIEIIGIVPEDIETLEIGLSDSVRNSIPKAVEQILSAAVI
ncbi:MAG: hydrogenase maturation protease [Leptospirales bacterium]|nr:hydrogenase maturation protease [Leptospirales bacterium]